MKSSPRDIAKALIDTCKTLPSADHAAAIDAAITILEARGISRDIRTFPRLVAEVLMKEEKIIFGRLITPTGESGDAKAKIVAVLEKAFGKSIDLTEEKDPSLLGGALLQIGDERFDASIRGSLERLREHITASNSPVA